VEAEKNKAIVSKLIEDVFNGQNPDAVDKYFTSDSVNHDPNNPQVCSPEEIKQWIAALKSAFPVPYYHCVIDDMIAEGDQVTTRWTVNLTSKGEYAGIPPTGKQAILVGATINRLVGDKVAESWWNYDMLGMLQQLGMIPKMSRG
jgi:predicted ester cyclase